MTQWRKIIPYDLITTYHDSSGIRYGLTYTNWAVLIIVQVYTTFTVPGHHDVISHSLHINHNYQLWSCVMVNQILTYWQICDRYLTSFRCWIWSSWPVTGPLISWPIHVEAYKYVGTDLHCIQILIYEILEQLYGQMIDLDLHYECISFVVQWIRPQTLSLGVPSSNLLAAAVVSLGKVLYPHCLVPWKGFQVVGPLVTCL